MGSKRKIKDILKEKVHFSFFHGVLLTSLVLIIVAGCLVFFGLCKPGNIGFSSPTATPANKSVDDLPVFSGITDPRGVSERLSKLEATATEWTNIRENDKMNGIYFIPSDGSSLNVYNVAPDNVIREGFSFEHFDHIWVDSDSQNFYTVVNISGKIIDLSDYYILVRNDSDSFASFVIFNCYEAEEIILDNAIITGTILAPKANIICKNTYLYGQLYGKTLYGSIKYCKDIPFSGYDEIIDNLEVINFKTRAVKMAVCDALFKIDPVKYYDYTIESDIVMADIKKITSLELTDLAIITFEDDLKYFTHISSISLRNSFIKNVDFSMFPNLVSLDISYSALDFTDLSKTPQLRSLFISGKNIEDFDFSNVPELIYLECYDCNITNENYKKISAITKLESLFIGSNPELTELDLSHFTHLCQLDISDSNLSEVNLSAFASSLTYLKCSNCGFTDIDLTNFVFLKVLEAYGFENINLTGVSPLILRTFLHEERAVITGYELPEAPKAQPETQPES